MWDLWAVYMYHDMTATPYIHAHHTYAIPTPQPSVPLFKMDAGPVVRQEEYVHVIYA